MKTKCPVRRLNDHGTECGGGFISLNPDGVFLTQ